MVSQFVVCNSPVPSSARGSDGIVNVQPIRGIYIMYLLCQTAQHSAFGIQQTGLCIFSAGDDGDIFLTSSENNNFTDMATTQVVIYVTAMT